MINIEKAEAATASTDIKNGMLGASDNMALSAHYTPEGTGITSGAWSKLSTMGTIVPKETSIASTRYLKSYAGLVISQDMVHQFLCLPDHQIADIVQYLLKATK